jgi:hypothetical protein
MGCCETRDDRGRIKKVAPDYVETPKSKTQKNPEAIDLTDSESSASVETKHTDPKHILKFLEFCKQNKNFQQLIDLITDTTEVESAPTRIGWADKPKTVGSLSLVYLCQLMSNHSEEIVPLLEKSLLTIVTHIKSGSDDLRDNSLMLLFYSLDYASENAVSTLIQVGIFQLLMRSILCQKAELRHVTASICFKLYEGRPYAKKAFIDLKGGKQLIQQILWSSENDEMLRSLLDYLIELVLDEEGCPNREFVEILNQENALDIIRDINNTDKSIGTLEAMDELMSMLSNED